MYDCGPRPPNWPEDHVLETWAAADIMNLANEYWFWGERCEKQLVLARKYLECAKGDKSSCNAVKQPTDK